MKVATKKRVVFVLYVLFVILPLGVTFALLERYRPSSIKSKYLASWENALDLSVEADSCRVEERNLTLQGFRVRSGDTKNEFLFAPELVAHDFGQGRIEVFRSVSLDLARPGVLRETSMALERILRKHLFGMPPLLFPIGATDSSVKFSLSGQKITMSHADLRATLEGRDEIVLVASLPEDSSGPVRRIEARFRKEGLSIIREFRASGPGLPLPGELFPARLFSDTEFSRSLDWTYYWKDDGKEFARLTATGRVDLGALTRALRIGESEGSVPLEIEVKKDGSVLQARAASDDRSKIQFSGPAFERVLLLFGEEGHSSTGDSVSVESLGLSFSFDGQVVRREGIVSDDGTWCVLADGSRFRVNLEEPVATFASRLDSVAKSLPRDAGAASP